MRDIKTDIDTKRIASRESDHLTAGGGHPLSAADDLAAEQGQEHRRGGKGDGQLIDLLPSAPTDSYVLLPSSSPWCEEQGLKQRSSTADFADPKVLAGSGRTLSDDELIRLFKAAQYTPTGSRDVAMMSVSLDTGCGTRELIAMRLMDLDLSKGRISNIGEDNKKRTLFIRPRTIRALRRYINSLAEYDAEPELGFVPIFLSRSYNPMTRSAIRMTLHRLAKRAGITRSLSLDAFRSSFLDIALRNGASAFFVQETLGLKEPNSQHYAVQMSLTDREKQHGLYSPMEHLDLPEYEPPGGAAHHWKARYTLSTRIITPIDGIDAPDCDAHLWAPRRTAVDRELDRRRWRCFGSEITE